MKKILVTTTNSIEGNTIQKYFDPVSANVVVGTNLFSDIGASWVDLFGGRSSSYENKLQQIYDQAVLKLKHKIRAKGANAIVGLKIDIDEISGKGTQMFMITALGTPVLLYNNESEKAAHLSERSIDGALVEMKIKAEKLLKTKLPPEKLYTDEYINFMIETRFPVFIKIMLDGMAYYTSNEGRNTTGVDVANKKIELISEYFTAIEPITIQDVIYEEFNKYDKIDYLKQLLKIVATTDVLDYSKAIELMRSKNLETAKFGLWITAIEKKYYTENDVNDIEEVIKTIEEEFKPVSEVTSKKKLLGSGEKQVWTCTCGKTNDADDNFCMACSKDIFGFVKNERTPQSVANLLKHRLQILTESLKIEIPHLVQASV